MMLLSDLIKLTPPGTRVRMIPTYAIPDGQRYIPTKTWGLHGTLTAHPGMGAVMIHIDGDDHPSYWQPGDYEPLEGNL